MIDKIVLFLLLILLVSACEPALDRQAKLKPYSVSKFFENQSAARNSIPGTVPFGKKSWTPGVLSKELLFSGQQKYDIYCSVCHGYTGHGDGMAVQRGFPAPADLHLLQALSVEAISIVIASGTANMPSFSSKLSEEDRWAVANYVKALQLSEHFPRNLLSKTDLEQLEKVRP